jgi:hypothetical protein
MSTAALPAIVLFAVATLGACGCSSAPDQRPPEAADCPATDGGLPACAEPRVLSWQSAK